MYVLRSKPVTSQPTSVALLLILPVLPVAAAAAAGHLLRGPRLPLAAAGRCAGPATVPARRRHDEPPQVHLYVPAGLPSRGWEWTAGAARDRTMVMPRERRFAPAGVLRRPSRHPDPSARRQPPSAPTCGICRSPAGRIAAPQAPSPRCSRAPAVRPFAGAPASSSCAASRPRRRRSAGGAPLRAGSRRPHPCGGCRTAGS
jgi:hypothetical protein